VSNETYGRKGCLGSKIPLRQSPSRLSSVSINADTDSLQLDVLYLTLPSRRDEASLQRTLERALLLTVRTYRRDRLLAEKLRQTLAQFSQQTPNADALGNRLNLSVRTLHLQLKDEGSDMQQLNDAICRNLAPDVLYRSKKPPKKIAEAMEFQREKVLCALSNTGLGRRRMRFGDKISPNCINLDAFGAQKTRHLRDTF
jgi:hypothetical protein